MNEVRVIFSPHTADPRFVQALTDAVITAQISVAQAVWDAQMQALQAMMAAQFTFWDTVCQAAARPS